MKNVCVYIHLKYYSTRKNNRHLQEHGWTHEISWFKKQDRYNKKNKLWFHLLVESAEDDPIAVERTIEPTKGFRRKEKEMN